MATSQQQPPQVGQQQPPIPAQQPQSAAQSQQQPIDDPASKVKVLVPHLRESLVNLMKITSHNFLNYASIDNATKSENQSQRLDKTLEEFYSICDRIELNLRLAKEYTIQGAESAHHTPIALSGNKADGSQGDTLTNYSQYISTVKTQINCAREIHDVLQECHKKFASNTLDK
ncbi:mediator of RNA polymerase II transcription subunit 29-like [Glandiceps talaboti]